MRWIAISCVLALAADAVANGRPAEMVSITFGPDGAIAGGTTFGLVVSRDGGATWRWTCEDALSYGGEYDPDFAFGRTGALFATSFKGLQVTSDGCVFAPATPLGEKFASQIARGPDGALYAGLVEPANTTTMTPGDPRIYRSTDDGATFPTSAMPAPVGTWWHSLEVAPSDPLRVYASGYRIDLGVRTYLLFRSSDGGATYEPMQLTGLTTSPNSLITFVGISAQDRDELYVRVTYQNNAPNNDAIFRSLDAGATWTPILAKPTSLAFVVRANGDLVAGTRAAELWVSRAPSRGDAWEPVASPPHVNCLVEHAGEVWACTQNYAPSDEPKDDAGIMRSSDLATWTPVLKFQAIAGPVACAAGTVQHDTCVVDAQRWCMMRRQFGIVADPTDCAALVDGAPSDATDGRPAPSTGCCDARAKTNTIGLGLLVLLGIRRRRR